LHAQCFNTEHRTYETMAEGKTTAEALASYAGTVTLCSPGKPRAPDAKEERGQAQFQCRCGHAGTMPYPKLFKRLRRRKPMRLRCELCGEVLR
jgi:hypothetical protein